VRYRADEASRRELTELIDVEQECCGFVTWTVTNSVQHGGGGPGFAE
jgi:hypothetical protein